MRYEFPKNFLWGAATSAHQVEGNNHNNWSEWEKKNAEKLAREAKTKYAKWQQDKFPEMFDPANYISGAASDHYNRYEEDFDIAKSLGHNTHRFSVEWSRVEPEEGKWNEEAIEHYRTVIKALRARGIEPFVMLWHWTEPIWFNNQGGWATLSSAAHFERFVRKVVSEYKDQVKFWVVVNEPNVSMGYGYYVGSQPPGKKGVINLIRGYTNLFFAFKRAARAIKEIEPSAEIGVANSVDYYEVRIGSFKSRVFSAIVAYLTRIFLRASLSYCTFLGVNYYRRNVISFPKFQMDATKRTDLGWEIFPEGIYTILMSVRKHGLPVYITENGIADGDDSRRPTYVRDHLAQVARAINDGVDVRAYFHWSLLDNFEFPDMRGFWPRFGLVEVDFKTQKRTIRPSAYEYAKICKENAIEI